MIRVLIASHAHLVSDLLEVVLGNERDIQVVGHKTSVEEAMHQAARCDVVLVSAALPNEGALKLTQSLGADPCAPRVVVVGAPETESIILRYLEAGAAGCVRGEDSVDELLQAVRVAARQQVVLAPWHAALVMQRVADLADLCRKPGNPLDSSPERRTLTCREREVLDLMAHGYRNQEIARHLTIELGTAKNHVHNMLAKLAVSNRKDAVACWSLSAEPL